MSPGSSEGHGSGGCFHPPRCFLLAMLAAAAKQEGKL
jgi:hypothetical protein